MNQAEAPRSFSEWEAEYASFDVPSLLAEAATLGADEPFNRAAAMFVRLADLACIEPGLTVKERRQAGKLADAVARDLWAMTASDAAVRARFLTAFDTTLERVSAGDFGAYALLFDDPAPRTSVADKLPNSAENLRQLLLEIYIAGAIRDDLPGPEWDRLHTTLIDAAEGRPFEPLGLPFPRSGSEE
jgi:hypothetical protein